MNRNERKKLCGYVRMLLVCVSLAGSMSGVCCAAQSMEMTANLTPQVTEITGTSRIELDQARYPYFKEFSGGTDPDCEEYLSTKFNNGDVDGTAQDGLSLAPLHLKSKFSGKAAKAEEAAFEPVEEFTYKLSIPKEYRKTGKVIVTWTIEVFGKSPCVLPIENNLCEGSWYGISTQYFSEGYSVISRCIVNGDTENPKGEARVSMPEGTPGTHTSTRPPPEPPDDPNPPIDDEPVMTGSAVITADNYGSGELPASMEIEIYWKNDSPLAVYSPAKSRQMTVTLMPLDRAE